MKLCGCYHDAAHGAVKIREPLPQVDVKAHTTIFSTASETELTQTFTNPYKTEDISECQYVFPLYDGVSVVQFTCQVGSRVINGVVKEKVEAKKVFVQAVSQGETAGLLEQGPSSDVFVASLGNIPAGEKIYVKIRFIGELKHDLALQGIRFTLPTAISPRYGSGAPQGNIESSSAKGISITVDISMPTGCAIKEVRSPSHPIALSLGRTSLQSNGPLSLSRASATLSLVEAALDKDFVLEVCHEDSGKPMSFLETHPTIEGQRALMTTLVPPKSLLRGENPEIIIVADQSGSMQGGRTATLVNALKVLLKSLPVGIKFNICAFGSDRSFLWKQSRKYDEKSLAQALEFLGSFGGNLGGTETLGAVQASIMSRDPTQDLSLILATDGDIWQQDNLFSYIDTQVANSEKNIRVFPLGIGNSVSSGLIEGVARAGKGFASSVGEGEQLETKVMRMLKGAMTPDSGNYTMEIQYHTDHDEDEYDLVERVADSLRIMMVDEGSLCASAMVIDDEKTSIDTDTSNAAGIVAPKLLQVPQVLPPLYPLSKTTVYIMISPKATRATPKAVIFRNDVLNHPFEISIPVEVLPEPATTIHSLAAKRAVVELEDGRGWLNYAKDEQSRLIKDSYPVEKFEEIVKAEAVRLGVQYQITGRYTSSVAVESSITHGNVEQGLERDIVIAPRPASPTFKMSQPRGLAAVNVYSCASATPPPPGSALFGGGMPPLNRLPKPFERTRSSSTPLWAGRGGASSYGTRGGASSIRTRGGVASFCSTLSSLPTGSDNGSFENMALRHNEDESIVEGAGGEGSTKVLTQQLQKLIELQTFAGFWKCEKQLLEICSISGFSKPSKELEPNIWSTIIALEFLDLKFSEERETWEMLADKAWVWLESQGLDRNGQLSQMLLKEARIAIQKG